MMRQLVLEVEANIDDFVLLDDQKFVVCHGHEVLLFDRSDMNAS